MRVICVLFRLSQDALLLAKDPADALRLLDTAAQSAFDVDTILRMAYAIKMPAGAEWAALREQYRLVALQDDMDRTARLQAKDLERAERAAAAAAQAAASRPQSTEAAAAPASPSVATTADTTTETAESTPATVKVAAETGGDTADVAQATAEMPADVTESNVQAVDKSGDGPQPM